jgi:dTDP-4-amino-4,6-dideoxygalactose transaminase
VTAFERTLAELTGAAAVWAVDSGRIALRLALQAIGVAPGDEVIVPSFLCPVVVDAIVAVQATPVLIDCDPRNGNARPDDAERKISSKTRALIVAHVFGNPARVDVFQSLCEARGIVMIEDCAHAYRSSLHGREVGTFGDLAILSFNFDKPLTTGRGGALLVNASALIAPAAAVMSKVAAGDPDQERLHLFGLVADLAASDPDVFPANARVGMGRDWLVLSEEMGALLAAAQSTQIIERVTDAVARWMRRDIEATAEQREFLARLKRRLRRRPKQSPDFPNIPSEPARRLGAYRAALGLELLKTISVEQDQRRAKAAQLADASARGIATPLHVEGGALAEWIRYAVLAPDDRTARRMVAQLTRKGIQAGNLNWPVPVHALPAYRVKAQFDRGSLHASDDFARRVINLPIHGAVDPTAIAAMIDVLQGRVH